MTGHSCFTLRHEICVAPNSFNHCGAITTSPARNHDAVDGAAALLLQTDLWSSLSVQQRLNGGTPKSSMFSGMFPYKPFILGYLHLWKPPYTLFSLLSSSHTLWYEHRWGWLETGSQKKKLNPGDSSQFAMENQVHYLCKTSGFPLKMICFHAGWKAHPTGMSKNSLTWDFTS